MLRPRPRRQPREIAFVARHAALRARRGISLSDFLEAFRSYHNVVWDAYRCLSDGGRAADQALAAARTVIRHIDLATTEASAAYLEAQQLLVADGDRVRRDLLEDLLAGEPPATAAGLAAARAAGLEGDARCVLDRRRADRGAGGRGRAARGGGPRSPGAAIAAAHRWR